MSLNLLAERIAGEWISKQSKQAHNYRARKMSWQERFDLAFGGREWSKHIERQRLERSGLGCRPACYRSITQ